MNVQNNPNTEVIIKQTQQRGIINGYNAEQLEKLILSDTQAPYKLMPVLINNNQIINIPLKDLVILKKFTQNTQIAIQLVINKNNNVN